jgi:hypothetical protein
MGETACLLSMDCLLPGCCVAQLSVAHAHRTFVNNPGSPTLNLVHAWACFAEELAAKALEGMGRVVLSVTPPGCQPPLQLAGPLCANPSYAFGVCPRCSCPVGGSSVPSCDVQLPVPAPLNGGSG